MRTCVCVRVCVCTCVCVRVIDEGRNEQWEQWEASSEEEFRQASQEGAEEQLELHCDWRWPRDCREL